MLIIGKRQITVKKIILVPLPLSTMTLLAYWLTDILPNVITEVQVLMQLMIFFLIKVCNKETDCLKFQMPNTVQCFNGKLHFLMIAWQTNHH